MVSNIWSCPLTYGAMSTFIGTFLSFKRALNEAIFIYLISAFTTFNKISFLWGRAGILFFRSIRFLRRLIFSEVVVDWRTEDFKLSLRNFRYLKILFHKYVQQPCLLGSSCKRMWFSGVIISGLDQTYFFLLFLLFLYLLLVLNFKICALSFFRIRWFNFVVGDLV